MRRYATRYGIDPERHRWEYGLVRAEGGSVFVQRLFSSRDDARRRGTLAFVHGFLLHSGLWIPRLSFLLDEGWDLCLIDLPGHGLSGGERGGVDDFNKYGGALSAALAELAPAARGYLAK
jgi:alpha-beta hydrolase superfamily lysophospholipase